MKLLVSMLASLLCFAAPAFVQGQVTCGKPGDVVAQGRESAPTGKLRVISYRLEKQDDKYFCLNVKMESTTNAGFLIWINDNPMGSNELRSGEVTARFPLDWLEQGAKISISNVSSRDDLTSFKERLRLPESIIRLQKTFPSESIKISAIRRVYRYAGFNPAPVVEIEVTKDTGFNPVIANSTWTLQIGNAGFSAGVDSNHPWRLTALMSEETFAKLKDGDLVRVSFANLPAKSFAKLDKKIFERAITQGAILSDVPHPADPTPHYLFYLSGYIVEAGNTRPVSPKFGAYEYAMILETLKDNGFVVISEAREKNPEIEPYARKLTGQITQLLKDGVPAKNITVVGASQGSWIAMLASTYLKNRGVNFVLIAACSADQEFLKLVNLHGNVLSIYERSDVAQSCRDYRTDATGISDWKEVEVNTGLKHGFLFRPMKEWVEPTVAWAKGKR